MTYIVKENNCLSEHLLTLDTVYISFLWLGYLFVCGTLVTCVFCYLLFHFLRCLRIGLSIWLWNRWYCSFFCFGYGVVYVTPIDTKITCWNFHAVGTCMSPLIASFFDGFKVRHCADAPALAAPRQNDLLKLFHLFFNFSSLRTMRVLCIIFRCLTLTHSLTRCSQ